MNVSSIVVKTDPEKMQDVMSNINAIELCEVHFNDDEGKIVVTIEGENIDEQIDRMKKIQKIPFVVSANLSYSYTEEEAAAGLDKIMASGNVPDDLN